MRHSDLGAEFKRIAQLAEAGWLDSIPDEPGLYAAVLGRPFARLKGETDILYIGQASKLVNGEPSTIRRRWKNRWAFPPYNEKDMRDVFRALMAEGETISLYCACAGIAVEDIPRREAELLHRFFEDHRELPPFNRAKPALKG